MLASRALPFFQKKRAKSAQAFPTRPVSTFHAILLDLRVQARHLDLDVLGHSPVPVEDVHLAECQSVADLEIGRHLGLKRVEGGVGDEVGLGLVGLHHVELDEAAEAGLHVPRWLVLAATGSILETIIQCSSPF